MIYDKIHHIWTDEIQVDRDARQRSRLDSEYISGLAKQIQNSGLIHAILIDSDNKLISGENRLRAFEYLQTCGAECPFEEYNNWQQIPARYAKGITQTEKSILELSENLQSKALTWQDTARAFMRIHDLLSSESEHHNEDLTIGELSVRLGVKWSTVQSNLFVAGYLEEEEIASCSSLTTAVNILRRRQDRQFASIIEDISYETPSENEAGNPQLEPSPGGNQSEEEGILPAIQQGLRPDDGGRTSHSDFPGESLPHNGPPEESPHSDVHSTDPSSERPFRAICDNFIDFAHRYSSSRFNFIHCDFPYGINLHKSATMKKSGRGQYEDTPEIFDALLECLLDRQESLIASSAHILFWHSAEDRERIKNRFEEAGWRVWKYPIIWHKSCNTGLFPDSNRGPRHTHEMALFASRGDRKITRLVADSYSGPTVKSSGHESEKPLEMLEHFFTMLVDETTTILDPTGGSGNALRAARQLGATRGLMLEINSHYCQVFNSDMRKEDQ